MRGVRTIVGLCLAVSLAGCGYNRIQELDEQAEAARSNIGVELENRNKLIPNMVETVRGASEFERGTYTDVAKARAGQAEQQLTQSAQQLDQAVDTRNVQQMQQADAAVARSLGLYINAVREAYPNLTATQNFQALQDQLAESENKIANARRDYNTAAQTYNTYIRRFPVVITARMSGAERKEFYQAPAGAEEAPKVDFGTRPAGGAAPAPAGGGAAPAAGGAQ